MIYRIGYFLCEFGILFAKKCSLDWTGKIENVTSLECLLSMLADKTDPVT